MTPELAVARAHYNARRWRAAREAFEAAPELAAEDLERLATAAYLVGDTEAYYLHLERAFHAYDDPLRAAGCAVWIAVMRYLGGEVGQADGWFARARRLIAEDGRETALVGHLLVPEIFDNEARGDLGAALRAATRCEDLGRRLGDPDLVALAGQVRGQLLIRQGDVAEGVRCLDEAMVAASSGELSPIANGIVYCGVIVGCRMSHDLRRAREWTSVMRRWCEAQPDLVPYTGLCRVHHAELLDLSGEWPEALQEAEAVTTPTARAHAAYVRGELHRRLGRLDSAEEAYREASGLGREPQPGLGLLRLAQGRTSSALAMTRRFLAETSSPDRRARLLPAAVDVLAAAGELGEAAASAQELDALARRFGSSQLTAHARFAAGTVHLARGEAREALGALRAAAEEWTTLGAPYELARARQLVGIACRALGDHESGDLELTAARATFRRLGVEQPLAADRSGSSPLTPRETEVLALLARGASNREIAATLVLSERTVHRHVSNIFRKLGVASRTAAAAHAFEHRLV